MNAASSASSVLAFGPEMTIVQAADNHQRLMSAFPALQTDARLDLSSVTEFDSSGVQLLLALRASLAAQGQTLHLLEPSPIVCDALMVFGLLDQFPLADNTAEH